MRNYFQSLCTLLMVLAVNQQLSAQQLVGAVRDIETKESIPYATVYLNGTTTGTLTDEAGNYQLDVSSYPAEMVVSHLNYETVLVRLEAPVQDRLVFELKDRAWELTEISVEGEDRRAENLREFTTAFLGEDTWGGAAAILNPEVIRFSRDYTQRKRFVRMEAQPDGSQELEESGATVEVPINLKAQSRSAIIVDQPETGYKIHVDLAAFKSQYPNSEQSFSFSSYLGYYFFEPYQTEKKRLKKRYARNRQKAYYESALHFFRALYAQRLAENGYAIKRRVKAPDSDRYYFENVDLEPYLYYQEDGDILEIRGLEEEQFYIFYYTDHTDYKPLNLTKRKGKIPSQSQIRFWADTCLIRSDGTLPDSNISFGGTIGEKKVAAMLPDNYTLPEK